MALQRFCEKDAPGAKKVTGYGIGDRETRGCLLAKYWKRSDLR
jgi:hypothetical protein